MSTVATSDGGSQAKVVRLLKSWINDPYIPVGSDGHWSLTHEHMKALYRAAGIEDVYRVECDPETY